MQLSPGERGIADVDDRYAGRPFLRLLECYALWAAGELSEAQSARLMEMTPKLRGTYGRSGSWHEIVAVEMGFSDDLPAALRTMWERTVAVAEGRPDRPDAEEWARQVVDTNFV